MCSVLLNQIITTLAFYSIFHFQVDFFFFFDGTSLQNVAPFSLGFTSYLLIAWIHPFHLPHSSRSSCVLLEDLFSVSLWTRLYVKMESLFSQIIFFSHCSVPICLDTRSKTCFCGICPDSYTEFLFALICRTKPVDS